MTDEAATGVSQTAASVTGEQQKIVKNKVTFLPEDKKANPTVVAASATSELIDTTNVGNVAANEAPTVATESESTVEKVEDFIKGVVDYLKSELRAGEEKVGQYFQLHFRKHENGHHIITLQPSGRAGDLKEFNVSAEANNG